MNTKDSNVCQGTFPAFYWVVAYGTDCDGFNRGHVYAFANYSNAAKFWIDVQKGSDGLVYELLCRTYELMNYCQSFDLDYTKYLTIYE